MLWKFCPKSSDRIQSNPSPPLKSKHKLNVNRNYEKTLIKNVTVKNKTIPESTSMNKQEFKEMDENIKRENVKRELQKLMQLVYVELNKRIVNLILKNLK